MLFSATIIGVSSLAIAPSDKSTPKAYYNTNWPADCAQCGVVTHIEKASDAKSGTGGAYAGKKIAEGNKEYKITIRMRDGEIKYAHQETLSSIKVGSMVRLKDGKAKLYK